MDDVLVDFESYINKQLLSLITNKLINHPSLTFLRVNVEKLGNLSNLAGALRIALNAKDSGLELTEISQHLLKISYIPITDNQTVWESLPISSKARELVTLSISLVGFENVNFLTAPLAFLGNKEDQLTRVKCIQIKLGEPDESGRRRPIPIKGSEFIMNIDTVVVAIGQGANPLLAQTTPDLKLNRRGYIQINEETGQSSIPQVFAGGDIVTGAATVIAAMGAGKKAARGVDEYLNRKW